MKLYMLAAAMLIGAPAFAQAPAPAEPAPKTGRQGGLYIGAGIASIAVDEDPISIDPAWSAFQVRAGYNLNKYLGFEGNVNFGFNSYLSDGVDVYETSSHELAASYGGFVVPRAALGDVGIYGRFGYVINNYDFGSGNTTEASGPAFGIGVDVDFSRMTFYLDLTAMMLTSADTIGGFTGAEYDATGATLALGLLGRF